MSREDYILILDSSFPSWFARAFRRLPKTKVEFRERLAKRLIETGAWAFEFDIRVISNRVKRRPNGLSHTTKCDDSKHIQKKLATVQAFAKPVADLDKSDMYWKMLFQKTKIKVSAKSIANIVEKVGSSRCRVVVNKTTTLVYTDGMYTIINYPIQRHGLKE